MSPATAKIFVLDTNVILHDANCISKFGKSDLVIPITVLEELDKFKRGNENIHFQAREFVRRLSGHGVLKHANLVNYLDRNTITAHQGSHLLFRQKDVLAT